MNEWKTPPLTDLHGIYHSFTQKLNGIYHQFQWYELLYFSFKVREADLKHYSGIRAWNDIPVNIREPSSLRLFKTHLKRHLMSLEIWLRPP